MRILSLSAVRKQNPDKAVYVDFSTLPLESGKLSPSSKDAFSAQEIFSALDLTLLDEISAESPTFSKVETKVQTTGGAYTVSWEEGSGRTVQPSNASERPVASDNPAFFQVSDLLKMDPEGTKKTLSRNDSLAPLIGTLIKGPEPQKRLISAAVEIVNQKEALLNASKKVISSITLLSEEEENKLRQQLLRAQQEFNVLQGEIQKYQNSIDWLNKTSFLKDELSKFSKLKATVEADISRFGIKRAVLEKAVKFSELEPEYIQIRDLREKNKETQKLLSDFRKNQPFLSEKVRTAKIALTEAQSNYEEALGALRDKRALVERARSLDEEITALQIEQKNKKEQLVREQTAYKLLQEDVTRLRTFLSQLNMKAQLLTKKMDDQSTDAVLVDELDSYARQIEETDLALEKEEEGRENQKRLQKNIESIRATLSQTQADIAILKNEELGLLGELSVKKRAYAKLLGNDSIDSLKDDLSSRNIQLKKAEALSRLISELSLQHEEQTRVKDELAEKRRSLRISQIKLSAAKQALEDKNEVVAAMTVAHEFYLQVLSFSPARQKLVNGKPCPLCGAIHHPYAANFPFDTNTEAKLKKAKEEAAAALQTEADISRDHDALVASLNHLEAQLTDLSNEIAAEISSIMAAAAELGIAGLREKKPIVWASAIKQKITAFTNRRDDAQTRLDKILEIAEQIRTIEKSSAESAEKFKNKRAEAEAMESKVKACQEELQNLSRAEKDSELFRFNLSRQLERIYSRFGLKASTLALQKQNFPTLIKRRDQWLSWSREKEEMSSQINGTSDELQNSADQFNRQKVIVDELEKYLDTLGEKLKRIVKERHDAIPNHDPEDAIGPVDSECSNAKRLRDDAQSVFDSRQSALDENQQKIAELDADHSKTAEQIETLNNNFTDRLHDAGFPNEAAFLSSQISEIQKEELHHQNIELEDRLAGINKQIEERRKELDSYSAVEHSSMTRAQLDELLNQKTEHFHIVSGQIAALREKTAASLNNRNRRTREENESKKLQQQISKWQEISAPEGVLQAPSNLALELLLFHSAEALSALDGSLKLMHEGDRISFQRTLPNGAQDVVKFLQLTPREQCRASLALLIGRAHILSPEVFSGGLLLLQGSTDRALSDYYREAVGKLEELGTRILIGEPVGR